MLPRFWMRREVLDDHLLAGHPDGPAGERDGDDHRQELRRQPDREGDREQQRLEAGRAARRTLTTQHEEDEDEHGLQ